MLLIFQEDSHSRYSELQLVLPKLIDGIQVSSFLKCHGSFFQVLMGKYINTRRLSKMNNALLNNNQKYC